MISALSLIAKGDRFMSIDSDAASDSIAHSFSNSTTDQAEWSPRKGTSGDPFSLPEPAMDSPFRERHFHNLGCPTCRRAAVERKAKALRVQVLCFAVPSGIVVAMGLLYLALTLLRYRGDLKTASAQGGAGATLALLIVGLTLGIAALRLSRRRRRLQSQPQ